MPTVENTSTAGPGGRLAHRLLDVIEIIGDVLALAISTVLALPVILFARVGNALLSRLGLSLPGGRATRGLASSVNATGDAGGRGGDKRVAGALAATDATAPASDLLPRHSAFAVGAAFALTVLTWALQTTMQRVDSALQQMGLGAGSALGFPVSVTDLPGSLQRSVAQRHVNNVRAAWTAFGADTGRTDTLQDPLVVAGRLVTLDRVFILLYVVLLGALLLALLRLNLRTAAGPSADMPRRRRHTALQIASGALVLLAVVDVLEDWQLQRALVDGRELTPLVAGLALGPTMSALKLVLTAVVILSVVVVGLVMAASSRPLSRALVSARGVLYGLGAVALLLMVGIGADQVDDVIRAWDTTQMILAVVAMTALALTAAGVIRHLTSIARERPQPSTGRSPQSFLLGAGALLVVVGQFLRSAHLGWGLSAAGALLVLIWAAGLPETGLVTWPPTPSRRGFARWWPRLGAATVGAVVGFTAALLLDRSRAVGAVSGAFVGLVVLAVIAWREARSPDEAGASTAAGENTALLAGGETPARTTSAHKSFAHTATAREAARDRDRAALDDAEADQIVIWGDRLGRVSGAAIAALLVVVGARSTALDAFVSKHTDLNLLAKPAIGMGLALVIGIGICARRPKDVLGDPLPLRKSAWFWASGVALVAAAALSVDPWAVWLAESGGTLAIVFGGFTLVIGALALAASGVRRGAMTRYALPPALRLARFRRFPVVPFLLAWALMVSTLDGGGYHDIRRVEAAPGAAQAPTIAKALNDFVAAQPSAAARPVVLVGASGGGIRAAVWTALVMECLFGPGPVQNTKSLCAQGSGAPSLTSLTTEASKPTPVFIASGASGSSVGLAAWSARRTDLLAAPMASSTPLSVTELLSGDLVAPDVARLFVGDLPHALLAGGTQDRAAMLEQGWEAAWDKAAHGSGDKGNTNAGIRPNGAQASDQIGLRRGLRATWDDSHVGGAWSTPVLALNGSEVEDGCRFLASAVDFTLPRALPANPADASTVVTSADDRPDAHACRGPATKDGAAVDILPSTNELIDYLCPGEDVPLSTAAHISARFPYVSPTGRILRKSCAGNGLVPGPAVSYDADGGIFDNSGSGTAVDAWRALTPLASSIESQPGAGCLVPLFIQIDNSPPADVTADVTKPDPRPNELTAPITATIGQLASREEYARASAAAAFTRPVSASGRPVTFAASPGSPSSMWFRITLFGQPGPQPPLGWTLAPATVEQMRAQLTGGSNSQTIEAIRDLLRPARLKCTK